MSLEIGTQNPSLNVLAQYIKDLSVENPSPLEWMQSKEGELVSRVKLDMKMNPIADGTFEVVLSAQMEIVKEDKPVYVVDLSHATLINIADADQESLPVMLFLRAPMVAFPTLRHVLRLATLESGLPPFNLQESNFLEMLQQKLMRVEEEAAKASGIELP